MSGLSYKNTIQIATFSDFEPDQEKAKLWGDYWVKNDLETEFLKQGFEIVNKDPDIFLHCFGVPLKEMPDCYRILWIHSHPDMITSDVLSQYDKIYCLSPMFAKKIEATGFDCEVLIGGTSKKYMDQNGYGDDILFIGNAKNGSRKILDDIDPKYNISVYGSNYQNRVVNDEYVPNEIINTLYRFAKISLNDHHIDMAREGFLNPRIFDIAASGGFCISDRNPAIDKIFGDSVIQYNTKKGLNELIEYYLDNDYERAQLSSKAHEIAKNYTWEKMVQKVVDDLSKPKPVKVDLGCGRLKRRGFVGVDQYDLDGVDIVCDVSKEIKMEDDSVDFLIADNLLEHINPGADSITAFNEVHRVVKSTGKVKIIVPGIHIPAAFQDPTHVNYYVMERFDYYDVDHDRWKLYGSEYGIKPFKILSRETRDRFLEVVMQPVKESEPMGPCGATAQEASDALYKAMHNIGHKLVEDARQHHDSQNKRPSTTIAAVGNKRLVNAKKWGNDEII